MSSIFQTLSQIIVQECDAMESNLCVICFLDNDRHLVKVGEESL